MEHQDMTSQEKKLAIRKSYFINAAADIIAERGVGALTVKEVAANAGYHSSTLYNYFQDFDHLIFLASMRFVAPYAKDLRTFIKDDEDSLSAYLKVSELFAYHSFKTPEIFYTVFYSQIRERISDRNLVKEYYDIYPSDLNGLSGMLGDMALTQNIYQREAIALRPCAVAGYIREEDVVELSEIHNYIHLGMLERVLNEQGYRQNTDLGGVYLKYTIRTLKNYLVKPVDFSNVLRFDGTRFVI